MSPPQRGQDPLQRIGAAMHETLRALQERGASGLTPGVDPDAFWRPGYVHDCGDTVLVRQANRTLPDGRVVPGPMWAYRKTQGGQFGAGAGVGTGASPSDREERRLLADVAGVVRALGLDMDTPPEPGALLQLTTDRPTTDMAKTVRGMLRQFGAAFEPLQVVFAGQAPTAWAEAWELPAQPATVVVGEVWPSLSAPQLSAIADAVLRRRRRQTVVLLTGTGWDRAGAREREQFARLEDLVRRSGRSGRV